MKELSVIVPVRIELCNYGNLIKWLTHQDSLRLEVIVVVDTAGATLDQVNLFKNEIKHHDVVLVTGEFGNPGGARNEGLKLAKSEWIAFWDADDLPIVGNFLRMINSANQHNFDVCAGEYILKNSRSGICQFKKLPRAIDKNSLSVWIGTDPGMWRFAFRRRNLVESFRNFRMAEDQSFLLENRIFSHDIYVDHTFVYCYFYGGESQSTSKPELMYDLKKAVELTSNSLRNFYSAQERRFCSTLLVRQILTSIKRGDRYLRLWSLFKLVKILVTESFGMKKQILISGVKILRTPNTIPDIQIPLTGGLGNQLFELAFLLQIAGGKSASLVANIGNPRTNHLGVPEILSYQLPTNIDITDAVGVNWLVRKASGYMLRSGAEPRGLDKFVLFRFVSRLVWRIILSTSQRGNINPLEANGIGYFDINNESRYNFFYGYFQTHRFTDKVRDELKSLSLSEPSRLRRKYSLLSQDENPLVVHIRLGDYRNEESFGFPGKTYYAQAIEMALSRNSYKKIWVFSDEIENVGEFLPTQYRDRYRYIDEENASSAEILEVMRLGAGYVIANSTFSWWAAYLSYTSDPIVIAPTPWFCKIESPKNLVPPSWTLIKTVPAETYIKTISRV